MMGSTARIVGRLLGYTYQRRKVTSLVHLHRCVYCNMKKHFARFVCFAIMMRCGDVDVMIMEYIDVCVVVQEYYC